MSTYALPSRRTLYLKRDFKENQSTILAQQVTGLSIINIKNHQGLYHARVFIELANKAHVVSFDPSPTDLTPSGEWIATVIVSLEDNSNTADLDKANDFITAMAADATGADICSKLFDALRLDEYYLNKEGAGCRHWCATIIEKLQEYGYIQASSVDDFVRWEAAEHERFGSSFPVPRHLGHW